MRKSRAFNEFSELLDISRRLLKMESAIKLPIPAVRMKDSKGLRGGAIVLMVAAFESYLQMVFTEKVDYLNSKREQIDIKLLTENVWQHNVFVTLEMQLKTSPLNPQRGPRKDRVQDVVEACQLIVDGRLDATSLSRTQGNPNSSTVTECYKVFGILQVLDKAKPTFEVLNGAPVAQTFIADKLDEILSRRHGVAHNINVQNVSQHRLAFNTYNSSINTSKCVRRTIDYPYSRYYRDMQKA